MIYIFTELNGTNQIELNIEIRFALAGARADGAELLAFSIKTENCKLAVQRILNKLKKEGLIQFFVSKEQINERLTEAEYLKNKFNHVIRLESRDVNYYAKI